MISTQTLLLVGVFCYFGIGAFIACGVTATSLAFSGKAEPMAILLFFAWPFVWLFQRGPLLLFLTGLAATCFMTWLAYLIITPS